MRPLLILLLILISLSSCSTTGIRSPTGTEGALADSVSTVVLLERGGIEMNPLGFPGTIVLKALGLAVLHSDLLEEDERKKVDQQMGAAWTGAALNNLIQIIWIGTPIVLSLGAGAIAVIWILN